MKSNSSLTTRDNFNLPPLDEHTQEVDLLHLTYNPIQPWDSCATLDVGFHGRKEGRKEEKIEELALLRSDGMIWCQVAELPPRICNQDTPD